MSIVVLKLPDVKSEAEGRPQRCPSCKGEIFQRWGGRLRKIRDPQVRYVMVYRYDVVNTDIAFGIIRPEWIRPSKASITQAGGVDVGVGVELPGGGSRIVCLWGGDRPDECLAG